ncbi:putative ankyrin repeat protein [Megavirus vitis]|nr:putative ankyrin repeat protein [Megavirus vitis]
MKKYNPAAEYYCADNIKCDGFSKLMYLVSIFSDDTIIEKYIKKNKSEINLKNTLGWTALMIATANSRKYDNTNIISILLKYGAIIDLKNNKGSTALMIASVCSNSTSTLETVELLIKNGANINAQNNIGRTSLMIATYYSNSTSNLETIKLLVKNSADINLANFNNFTVLMVATYYHINVDVIKFLLESGANINAQENSGYTALMLALDKFNDNYDTITLLLKSGANSNLQNMYGTTALMIAVAKSNINIETINLLLEYGSDPNIQDFDNITALIISIKASSDENIIKLLLSRCININTQYKNKSTILMHACYNYNIGITELLLNLGANPNLQDDNGLTALMLTCMKSTPEILQIFDLLLKYKSDHYITDKDDKTWISHIKPEYKKQCIDTIEYYTNRHFIHKCIMRQIITIFPKIILRPTSIRIRLISLKWNVLNKNLLQAIKLSNLEIIEYISARDLNDLKYKLIDITNYID